MTRFRSLLILLGALAAQPVLAAQPSLESGTVMEAAERLEAGEYLWAPEIAPEGPVMLVVSLATQRAVVYRNGVPIGITTVSSGRPGNETPTGVFTILQKRVEHYSNLYDNAPMPFMQRLTWGGVALHGGNLPGYPASHGCIRLPQAFARLLFGVTQVGMTVIVTDRPTVPRIAARGELLGSPAGPADAAISWTPDRSPAGPVSILVSAVDRRAVVIRNGIVIGSSSIEFDGDLARTSAFVLRTAAPADREWIRIALPGQDAAADAPPELRGRIRVPDAFRTAVESVLQPGTTVVVTNDSLRGGDVGPAATVLEGF